MRCMPDWGKLHTRSTFLGNAEFFPIESVQIDLPTGDVWQFLKLHILTNSCNWHSLTWVCMDACKMVCNFHFLDCQGGPSSDVLLVIRVSFLVKCLLSFPYWFMYVLYIVWRQIFCLVMCLTNIISQFMAVLVLTWWYLLINRSSYA